MSGKQGSAPEQFRENELMWEFLLDFVHNNGAPVKFDEYSSFYRQIERAKTWLKFAEGVTDEHEKRIIEMERERVNEWLREIYEHKTGCGKNLEDFTSHVFGKTRRTGAEMFLQLSACLDACRRPFKLF